jgi:hypothetical protein
MPFVVGSPCGVCGNLYLQTTHCDNCDPQWLVFHSAKYEYSRQFILPRINAALHAALTAWSTPSGKEFVKDTLHAAVKAVLNVATSEHAFVDLAAAISRATIGFLKLRLEDGTWKDAAVAPSFQAIATLLDWTRPFYSGISTTVVR